jgi:autophagy-related protein 9
MLTNADDFSFVAFIAGSFAAVLVLATVLDPDIFVHFEITPQRTVLFYLGVFGSVLAVARGMIPDDNRVFDPELLMMEVITYTHYMPDEWKGELHSKKARMWFLLRFISTGTDCCTRLLNRSTKNLANSLP